MRLNRPRLLSAALIVLAGLCGPAGLGGPAPAQATAVEWGLAHQEWLAADKKLNAEYRQLMGELGPKAKKLLTASELAWIAFRDAEVAFHEDRMRGGSGASTLGEQVKAKLTAQRADALHGFFETINNDEDTGEKPAAAAIKQAIKDETEGAVEADRALNAAYRKVVSALDATARQKLAAAELKWIAFRDAEARVWQDLTPTPYAASLYQLGLNKVTQQRTENLQALLDLWKSRQ
jgi:uncharacterized protein YecT (DUF1311 family)